MAKYDSALGDLKNQVSGVKKVLIALPTDLSVDKLSGALALYQILSGLGKEASVVTMSQPQVAQSNLVGIDKVSNTLPQTGAGNLTITLEGVVSGDGTVPSLEKLDWFPEGNNLNLVFHTLPGQKFEPKSISPKYSGGGFDLIFIVGSRDLNSLGSIYTNNQSAFSNTTIINIDKDPTNTQFGAVNIIDPESSSISEMVYQVIQGLGLNLDADSSSNLLIGIYDSTVNLTTNAKPETFMNVGALVQAGGRVPQAQPISQVTPASPAPEQGTPAQSYSQNFPPLNQVFGFPVQPEQPQNDNFTVPPVVNQDLPASPAQRGEPSQEERPQGEVATSSNPETSPEPDWLTPKIFSGKSGNIG